MLWCGTQYFIDTFLKQSYDVRMLVYGNDSYPNLFKNALWESKHIDVLINVLGNINFLFPPPPGQPGFFDKFAKVFPIVWAGVFSVVTAGAGTPALIGIIGALAAKYATNLQKTKDQQQLVQQYEQWKLQNPENVQGEKVTDPTGKNLINSSMSPWMWVGIVAIAAVAIKKRKRKK